MRIQDSGFETLLVDDPQAAEERIVQRIAFEAAFMGDPSNANGYPRLLKARAGHDVYDRLKMIEAPTIVIAGERDGQAPIESGRAMARKIPGARFLSFDGGHNMTFATPGPVAAILKAWGR